MTEKRNSGAKHITINISGIADEMSNVILEIPNTVEYFELQGGRNTFSGLKIKSNAGTTVLNGITITDSTGIPLEISSESVTLNQVIVESPSYVLLLKSNSPIISLYGTSRFISSSSNAMVCRNVTLDKISSNVSSKLEITGDVLNCGALNNASLISFPERGEIVYITEDDYDKYIKGSFNVTFDVNEGNALDTTQKTVYFGSAYGELPTPTRDYYSFDGWFTAAEGGEEITAETVYNLSIDSTLYAHWTIHPLSGWVPASDAPSDASIENTKWDYTYTSNSTYSGSDTILDQSSAWSDYGSWSGWTTNAVIKSDSRDVEPQWEDTSYDKTQYVYFHYCNSNGTYYANYNDGTATNYHKSYYDSQLGGKTANKYGSGYHYSGDACSCGCSRWYIGTDYTGANPTRTVRVSQGYTKYRYRDRHLIYTYSLESTIADPTGQTNVSNVVKYVQYRAK